MKPNFKPDPPPRRFQRALLLWGKPAAGGAVVLVAYLLLATTAFHRSHPAVPAESGGPSHKAQRSREAGDLPKQLTSSLSSGKSRDKERALHVFLPDLIRTDISAAAAVAEALEPWASREEVLFHVARAWAARDPESAAAWARQLQDPAEADAVLRQVCVAVAQSDPLHALDLAGDHEPLRKLLLDLLARKAPEAALQWAERQTDPSIRNVAYAQVALGHAETEPEEAARWVAEHLPPGPLQDDTALAVLHQWIRRDPAGARAWVEIFPDGDLLKRAESELSASEAYQLME